MNYISSWNILCVRTTDRRWSVYAIYGWKEIITYTFVLIIIPHEHSTEIFGVFLLCDLIYWITMTNA